MKQFGVYKLETTPPSRTHISTCCVFREKRNENGKLVRYKALWVVKGFMQAYGIDYNLTHVPVSKLTPLRVILSMAERLTFFVNQLDVTTAFLNIIVEEHIYVLPSSGYEHLLPVGQSIRLIKELYGFKKSRRVRNAKLFPFLRHCAGMKVRSADRFLYTRSKNGKI